MLTTKKEITDWLDEYVVINYQINDDLTVDVVGDVNLERKGLIELPVQFRHISGGFDCSDSKLISLKGCPLKITNSFNCSRNNLTSLINGPAEVGMSYYCDNNQLNSLEHLPLVLNSHLNCSNNKLTSLKGCPLNIERVFDCSNNELTSLEGGPVSSQYYCCFNNKLTTLKGSPGIISGNFICDNNQLTSLVHGPASVGNDYSCSFNPIKDLGGFMTEFGDTFSHTGDIKIKELESFYIGDKVELTHPAMLSVLLNEKLSKNLNKETTYKSGVKI